MPYVDGCSMDACEPLVSTPCKLQSGRRKPAEIATAALQPAAAAAAALTEHQAAAVRSGHGARCCYCCTQYYPLRASHYLQVQSVSKLLKQLNAGCAPLTCWRNSTYMPGNTMSPACQAQWQARAPAVTRASCIVLRDAPPCQGLLYFADPPDHDCAALLWWTLKELHMQR